MSNFWTDPFGIKLIQCDNQLTEKDKEENTPPFQQPNSPAFYQCYYSPPNYGIVPLQQMPFQYYQVNMNPAMNFYQVPMQYPHMAPVPAPSPSPMPQPVHKCVACNSKRKCKKCIKEEEKQKIYVIAPNFWNPRSK